MATDNQKKTGLRDREGFLNEAKHVLLESRPFVRSIGLDVEAGGHELFRCPTHFHIWSEIC